jgi:hypothetical protein
MNARTLAQLWRADGSEYGVGMGSALPGPTDGREPPEPLRFQVVDLGFGEDAHVVPLGLRRDECQGPIWVHRMSNRLAPAATRPVETTGGLLCQRSERS